MKRLYLFLVLSFLWSINLYAGTPLSDVNLTIEEVKKLHTLCAHEKKFSHVWYSNGCDTINPDLLKNTSNSELDLNFEDKILAAPGMTIYFYFIKSSKKDQKKRLFSINYKKLKGRGAFDNWKLSDNPDLIRISKKLYNELKRSVNFSTDTKSSRKKAFKIRKKLLEENEKKILQDIVKEYTEHTNQENKATLLIAELSKIEKKKKELVYAKQFVIDDGDRNLKKLYNLIMNNPNFLKKSKKYFKYAEKGKEKDRKIKIIALAVYFNYEKELLRLTNNPNNNKVDVEAWGWASSDRDMEFEDIFGWAMGGVNTNAEVNCYKKAQKLELTGGECIIVDAKKTTGDSKSLTLSKNLLFFERNTRLLTSTYISRSDIKKDVETKKLAEKKAEEETKKQELLLAEKKKEEEKRKKELLLAQKKAEDERKKQEKILLAKKKQEEEKKNALILAQIAAIEKKVLKDKARYLEKKMTEAFLDANEIILDDLRGDGKVYYQFEKDKYFRIKRDGKFISEGQFKISESGRIVLNEKKDKFYWKLSVRDGVIDIKSKFYPYEGYKRFALDFIYKQIAKEERKDSKKLAKIEKKEKELQKKEIQSKEEEKVKELLLAQKKAEEDRKKQELLLVQKKAEEEKKKQELLLSEKKAEDERKKQELILAQKKAEEEERKQELLLAEKRAEDEKKKEELLAKLETENKDADNEAPIIEIAETITVKDSSYEIQGKVTDKSDKIFIKVGGKIIEVKSGKFNIKRFSPVDEEVKIIAIDQWGNESKPKIVNVIINFEDTEIAETLEPLDPSNIESKTDKNRVALIIGIEKYENTPDASYANMDAKYFYEYSRKGFGVPTSNIKLLIGKEANLISSLGIINKWLPSKIKNNETELFIYFAGHGLASADGKELYLLPQDSDPDLLKRTALSKNELFETILNLNPKSVTIFFDTCYSGVSRDEETLLASARPIRIVAEEQSEIPDNFTIFSASQIDQISSGLKEAKHGIFSYYLMKGLEGKADSNKDKKITNGELLAYMDENVSQKAAALGREQNPSLTGDPDKVLMNY